MRAGGHRVALVLALSGLVNAGALWASAGAQTPHSAGSRVDTVTGVVFDSLVREPLAGALVGARPHVAVAVADERGRFELISDSLVQQLVVHHASLDVMGLDGIGARRPDGATRWRDVRLATPSYATLQRAVCPSAAPFDDELNASRAILVGSTRRAPTSAASTTPVLLAGVDVQVAWAAPDGRVVTPRRTRTDSLGTWAVCDVPRTTELTVTAISVEYESGVVRLASDAHAVRRVDLLLGATGDRLGGVLRGRIVDDTGFPVDGARVAVDGVTGAQAVADRWGEFRLAAVPLGTRMVSAQAVGHAPVAQVVDVTATESAPLSITLPRVTRLEQVRDGQRVAIPVRVTDSVASPRAAFEARRRAAIDPDRALVAGAAEVRSAGSLSALFAGLPWIAVRPVIRAGGTIAGGDPSDWAVSMRGAGNCRVHVFVDGAPSSIDRVNALPFTLLEGIEGYANRAAAPAAFAGATSGRDCALVLVWTRRGLSGG
jgi:hypothetical protein